MAKEKKADEVLVKSLEGIKKNEPEMYAKGVDVVDSIFKEITDDKLTPIEAYVRGMAIGMDLGKDNASFLLWGIMKFKVDSGEVN